MAPQTKKINASVRVHEHSHLVWNLPPFEPDALDTINDLVPQQGKRGR